MNTPVSCPMQITADHMDVVPAGLKSRTYWICPRRSPELISKGILNITANCLLFTFWFLNAIINFYFLFFIRTVDETNKSSHGYGYDQPICFIGQDNKEQVITTETVIKQVRPISVVLIFRWKLGEKRHCEIIANNVTSHDPVE